MDTLSPASRCTTFRFSCPEAIIELEARPDPAAPGHGLQLTAAVRAEGMRARAELPLTRGAVAEYGGAVASLARGDTDDAVLGHGTPSLTVWLSRRPDDSGNCRLSLAGTPPDARFAFRIDGLEIRHREVATLAAWLLELSRLID